MERFFIFCATYFLEYKSTFRDVMQQLEIRDSFGFCGEINGGYFPLVFELTEGVLKQ